MRSRFSCVIALGVVTMLAGPAFADPFTYDNLTPNNLMAMATRPDLPGPFEIETADDFVVGSQTFINSASFVGLIVPGAGGTTAVSEVVAEMYRVFPLDSDTTRTPNVPTRVNVTRRRPTCVPACNARARSGGAS